MRRPSFPVFVALLLSGVATGALAQDPETFTYDALGRLIERETTGGANSGEVMSLCYDAVGNRTSMVTNSGGVSNHCDTGSAGTPSPSPSPTPTPTQTNSGPSTANDAISGHCYASALKNVVANDSDPEGDTPISLTAINLDSGNASAQVQSSTHVSVQFGPEWDVSYFTYTVEDALGNSSTGQLSVSTTSCDVEPL